MSREFECILIGALVGFVLIKIPGFYPALTVIAYLLFAVFAVFTALFVALAWRHIMRRAVCVLQDAVGFSVDAIYDSCSFVKRSWESMPIWWRLLAASVLLLVFCL